MKKHTQLSRAYQDYENIYVHINIDGSGHKYEITLQSTGSKIKRTVDMLPDDLYQLNEDLRIAFRKIVDSTESRNEQLQELAKEGRNAFLKIFDKKAREWLRELLSFSSKAIIEITTDEFFLPWELLYIEDIKKPLSIENFLGAKHIISRLIYIDPKETPFINPYINQVMPRVGLITNETDPDLEYIRSREIPFFERLRHEEKITLLKLSILNPEDHQAGMRVFEVFLSDPLEIAHFACHAIGDKRHDLSHMVLSNNFAINLSDLRALEELRMPENPIVVLNACGTGNINSKHASFFAKEFLNFGARGVIATDCEVPDLLAAEFSERFYSEFLNGTPIGEALFKTRRSFLERKNDLTVLIYSMYAVPMIKIQNRQLVQVKGDRYE
jgi:hypothetical protein